MDLTTLALLFGIVLAGFGIAVALMAVGQRLSGRCLRGSCGGPGVVGPDGERLSCADCPNRATHSPRA
jgi:hypothetical protein